MSKRQQEGKLGEEERVVAKSKPMMFFGIEDRKSVSYTGFGFISQSGDARNVKFQFRSPAQENLSREMGKM